MRSAWLSLSLLWLTGCSSIPLVELGAPPRGLSLGPVLTLLDASTRGMEARALIDGAGRARIVAVVPEQQATYHVLVDPKGGVSVERVADFATGDSPSVAMGPDEAMHVLVGDRHLVRTRDGWQQGEPPPWVAAGVEVGDARLVAASPRPAWAFVARGDAIDAPGRWDWILFGGAWAAVPVPLHAQSAKVVVARDDVWYVIDQTAREDAENGLVVALPDGSFFAVYDLSSCTFATISSPRCAAIPDAPADAPSADASRSRLIPVMGQAIPPHDRFHGGAPYLLWASMAADPLSGAVLLVRPHRGARFFADGRWESEIPLPLEAFREPRIAPAGDGRFHVLVIDDARPDCDRPVVDTIVSRSGAAPPFQVGCVEEASWWADVPFGAYTVAGSGTGDAFAVWPTRKGLEGRWILAPPGAVTD